MRIMCLVWLLPVRQVTCFYIPQSCRWWSRASRSLHNEMGSQVTSPSVHQTWNSRSLELIHFDDEQWSHWCPIPCECFLQSQIRTLLLSEGTGHHYGRCTVWQDLYGRLATHPISSNIMVTLELLWRSCYGPQSWGMVLCTMGLVSVILWGISRFFPTYFMVSTGKCLCRKNLQYDGTFNDLRAQAPAEAGKYLISW
jgi:hypothetical protein